MSLVRLRRAAQITLPQSIRDAILLKEGDYLEAEVTESGAILLKPVNIARREPSPAQEAEILSVVDAERRAYAFSAEGALALLGSFNGISTTVGYMGSLSLWLGGTPVGSSGKSNLTSLAVVVMTFSSTEVEGVLVVVPCLQKANFPIASVKEFNLRCSLGLEEGFQVGL